MRLLTEGKIIRLNRKLKINNGSGYNATATTLQLDTNDAGVPYVVAGSIIVNSRTGEVMRATAAGDTTNHRVTIARLKSGESIVLPVRKGCTLNEFAICSSDGTNEDGTTGASTIAVEFLAFA